MRNWKGKVTGIPALILLWLGSGSTLIWSMSYLVGNKIISLSSLLKSIMAFAPALITLAQRQQNESVLVKYQEAPNLIPSGVSVLFIISVIVFIPTTWELYKKVRDCIQEKK